MRWLSGASALAIVVTTFVSLGALPAQAADLAPASLRITKSVMVGGTEYDLPDAPTVEIGEEFSWNIEVICDQQSDKCVNATLTDVIPDEFEIVEQSINVSVNKEVTVSGQTVTVKFMEPLDLPVGGVGISASAHVVIPVKLKAIPQDRDGDVVTNEASAVADNAPEVSDDAAVTVHVPLALGAEASKSFDPETALAVPGEPISVTFGGKNTSNGAVDRLVVQDPADPAANPNIFQQYLQVTALDSVTWPAGADEAVVSVYADGAWVDAPAVAAPGALSLPAGVDAADIRGVRIAFTSENPDIPQNATTSVQLALSQRAAVSGLANDTTLANVSTATVGVDASEQSDDATAELTLRPESATVEASKSFSPDEISVTGDTQVSTVTLGAANVGTVPLQTLSIAEPSNPADLTAANMLAPAFGNGNVTFAGFGSVTWPQGTESVDVTYYFSDGSHEIVHGTTEDELPAATGTERITGFKIDFHGDAIGEGAEATVPFTVHAPDSMTVRKATGTNEITVSGETGTSVPNPADDTASDTLTVYNEQITIETGKTLTRTEVPSIPGQTTTAQLTARILPYPQTSTNPTQVIIDDPSDLTGVTDWYDHLDASAITLTQIPNNATLTVQYRNAAGVFTDFPDMVDIDGSTDGIFSAPIPAGLRDTITGVRFIYETPDGFSQSQQFSANVTYTTRASERTTGIPIPRSHDDPDDDSPIAVVENCSAAEAETAQLHSGRVEVTPPCPELSLMPVGDGTGPGIEKSWSPDLVFSHSRQNTTVNLHWSAGQTQGIDQIILSDMASVEANGNPSSLGSFDAFNLTQIGPINDPNFAYDQVAVQIWNGASWENLLQCATASPCSGANIPAIQLNATQQENAQAVRFIVTEKPGRTPSTPSDPLPGTGISLSDSARQIPLTLQLRDTLRSTGDPVVEGPSYNSGVPSQVLNTASLDGWVPSDDDPVYRDDSSDVINIVDTELAVTTTKTWGNSPVPIPQDWGTDVVPTTRVDVSVTNATTSGTTPVVFGYVNQLRLIEPGSEIAGEEESPFDAFDLIHFESLTAPQGTAGITVSFDGAGAPASVTATTAATALVQLQALDVAQLRNVTGITVTYQGQIPSGQANGTGRLTFDLELRQNLRSSAAPVTTADSPVRNTVLGTVTDARWDDDLDDFASETIGRDADAQVALQARNITVTANKTFNPTTQTEPSTADITMTLSGTPGGSERTKTLTLTDDRATFWNAYNFRQVANTLTLPNFSPAGNPVQVQFSVCTGRDFEQWLDDGATPGADCASTGGTWSPYTSPMSATQAQGWNPLSGAFSLGIDPAAVQGIRVQFTRLGDKQWENPKSPTVNLPMLIQRRADLRSGGAVPSTLVDGGSAAPGEAVKGVTTNTVRADVEGIWGGSSTASKDATITYAHARNAVELRKDPIGVKNPGQAFDYTLTVRNTGDRDVIDPVITDRLPWNADLGTLVQFDPDANPAAPRYSYALTGTNPSTGLPLPTDPENVTVVEDLDSDTPTMQFTFPSGTHLAPGQSYTITFSMMFVVGVTEGLPVVNSFDIVGDRVWDACTAPSGHTPFLSADATTCGTEALVTPQRLPLIISEKKVRAVGPAGTFNNHGFVDETACVNRIGAENFVKQPCVPRTLPGQVEDWRLSFTNNGTTPLTRLAVVDFLPAPGDSTLIANFPRNSQWTPDLIDTLPSMSGVHLPADATLTSYVSTGSKSQICMAGVNNPNNITNCIDETGANSTTKFIPFDQLTDKSTATALLFVVETQTAAPLPPGAIVNVDFQTKTGPYSQNTAEADPKAFNSLTIGALYLDGPTTTRVLTARDQSNVGVALITGSVRIAKTVTGPAAGFVPAGQTFSGVLKCTSQGVEIPDRAYTVTVGTPTTITNLPAGAVCTATETAASGQTTYVVSTDVTVPSEAAAPVPTLTITNDYQLTELVVRKQVDTDAEQFPSGFGFEVECSFLGQPIDLDDADAEFTLDHDGEHRITGLPVNAECTVTETDDRNADSTTVEAESLNADGSPHGTVTESGSSATIDGLALVDPDVDADETGSNAVEFTNTYGEQAAIRIEKDLVGGAADLGDDLTFDVDVLCTFENETLLDETVSLNRGNGWGETLSSLVAGAECAITEPNLHGADAVVITPNDGTDTTTGSVTIPSSATAPVLVTVTNRYLAGSLEVTKAVTGDGAALYGTGGFEISLACTLDGDAVRVIGGATRTVSAADPTATYTGLPSGAECTLTETDSVGATESRMRLSGGTWAAASDPGVTFTVDVDAAIASNDDQAQTGIDVENRFDLAEVSVTKRVDTDAVDADGTPISYGPFEVELNCTFLGDPITVTDAVQTIADGDTATWENLPAGALCSAEETATADADETWFEQAASDPDDDPVRTDGVELQLGALNPLGDPLLNAATLVNRFDSTTLLLTKVLGGNDAASAKGKTFVFDLVCTLSDATRPVAEEVWNGSVEVSAATGWFAEVAGLATGAECAITERETGDATRTTMSINGQTIGGPDASFVVDETQLTLKVTNTFTKALVVSGGAAVGAFGILAALVMLGGALVALRRRRRFDA